MNTKKKINYPVYIIVSLISGYIAYLLAAGWEKEIQIDKYIENMTYIYNHPIGWYFNSYTLVFVLAAEGIVMIWILCDMTKTRFMPGKEYGTAQWGDAKKITKRLKDKDESNNTLMSQNLKISLNTKDMNNNILVIGGSGAGKTFYFLTPNIQLCNQSMVITDPKGEILLNNGNYLKYMGYTIKVINLIDMKRSDRYNPFLYLRSEEDVAKLISNLMKNTTPKGATASDPFWEKSERLYLQALFLYVWLEMPEKSRNFSAVLDLTDKARIDEDGDDSDLDILYNALEIDKPNHPAVKMYRKFRAGAGDTMRSIIISANSRLAPLESEQVKRIMNEDDMDIASIGVGKNGDKKTKTAVFCVIPDSDKTYNFIVGMFYTQLFQTLYYEADFHYHGKLPIPVRCYLDEFANVALPDGFLSLLSTMRSRIISSVVIIQNIAQIKGMYKDDWEEIPGNCDTTIYLGGNEQTSHKYVSDSLGSATIYKKNQTMSRGRNGSTSNSVDGLGRPLMFPNEVGRLQRKKEIVFLKGENPVIDQKIPTQRLASFKLSRKLGRYIHDNGFTFDNKGQIIDVHIIKRDFEILSKESLQYYEMLENTTTDVEIKELSLKDLADLVTEQTHLVIDIDYDSLEKIPEVNENELKNIEKTYDKPDKKKIESMTIEDMLVNYELNDVSMKVLQECVVSNLSESQIKTCITASNNLEKMKNLKDLFIELNKKHTKVN